MKIKNIILSILLTVCMLAGGFGIYAINSASVPVSDVEERADSEPGNTTISNLFSTSTSTFSETNLNRLVQTISGDKTLTISNTAGIKNMVADGPMLMWILM